MEYAENWPNYKNDLFFDDSLTTEEIKSFVYDGSKEKKVDYDFYLGKWKNALEENSFYCGFNWPSFFIGSLWCLYRKMYLVAIALIIIEFIVSMFLGSILYSIGFSFVDTVPSSSNIYTWLPLIFTRIVFGLIANKIYLSHLTAKIIELRKHKMSVDDYTKHLSKKGGVSYTAFFIGLFISFVFKILEIINNLA